MSAIHSGIVLSQRSCIDTSSKRRAWGVFTKLSLTLEMLLRVTYSSKIIYTISVAFGSITALRFSSSLHPKTKDGLKALVRGNENFVHQPLDSVGGQFMMHQHPCHLRPARTFGER